MASDWPCTYSGATAPALYPSSATQCQQLKHQESSGARDWHCLGWLLGQEEQAMRCNSMEGPGWFGPPQDTPDIHMYYPHVLGPCNLPTTGFQVFNYLQHVPQHLCLKALCRQGRTGRWAVCVELWWSDQRHACTTAWTEPAAEEGAYDAIMIGPMRPASGTRTCHYSWPCWLLLLHMPLSVAFRPAQMRCMSSCSSGLRAHLSHASRCTPRTVERQSVCGAVTHMQEGR
jgi:hypothetical protein